MIFDRARARLRAVALAATTGLVLSGVLVGTPAAQAVPAPSGIRAALVATQAVGLTWDVTGEDAYRVRFATNAAMTSGVDTWDVRGNYFELTRTDANPTVSAPRLTPGRTYYFQVKAVKDRPSSGDRAKLSSYSKAVAVTLPTTGVPELEPAEVSATPAGPDGIHVSWRDRGPGASYVVRYTDDPSAPLPQWRSVTLDAAGGVVEGLAPDRRYWVRVRAVDSGGNALSEYSAAGPAATTGSPTSSPALTAISYNVRKIGSTSDWAARRSAVASTIKAAQPDVLGLQEASPLTWATNKKRQYADLMTLLGSRYALVTSGAGTSGTQLAYDTTRLTVLDSGSSRLYKRGSALRYAVWAVFRDRTSNTSFFAISTHLEPGSQTSSTLNSVRIRQARQVRDIARSRAGGRPVVILGDMNSSRAARPRNGQYDVFTEAGYVDPLDNRSGSWASGANATAEHVVDGRYNGVNGLARKARLTAYPLGTYIDYVFVSPNVRVASWRTVVRLDATGSFVGTIPSDHNLLQVALHLP